MPFEILYTLMFKSILEQESWNFNLEYTIKGFTLVILNSNLIKFMHSFGTSKVMLALLFIILIYWSYKNYLEFRKASEVFKKI